MQSAAEAHNTITKSRRFWRVHVSRATPTVIDLFSRHAIGVGGDKLRQ